MFYFYVIKMAKLFSLLLLRYYDGTQMTQINMIIADFDLFTTIL